MDDRNVVLVFGLMFLIAINLPSVDGSARTIIRHCCDIGKQWYLHSDRACSAHPMSENAKDMHTPCLLSVEICCTAEMRKQRCLAGKKSALQGGSSGDSSDDAKECYSCCRLGLKASIDVRDCQKLPRSQLFTSQCRQTFTQCCNQEKMDELAPPQNFIDVSEPCGKYGRHCSKAEKCVPHKKRGFICVPVKIEEPQVGPRTTPNILTSLETTDVRGNNSCEEGYIFNRINEHCEDVNECIETPQVCDSAHTCWNEPGGYKCLPRSTEIDNEVPKSHHQQHHHSHANVHHRLENVATTQRGDWQGSPLPSPEHSQIFHSRLDANDASVIDYSHPMVSLDEHFFAEVNNMFVDPIGDDSDVKASERPRTSTWEGGEKVSDDVRKTIEICREGQKYNEINKKCEDKRICNGQTCLDENMVCKIKLGKELCTCKSGFRYNPRAESCDDLDECREGSHTCQRNENCQNTQGSYNCLIPVGSCQRGYFYDKVSSECKDLDECMLNTHNCTTSQRCSNVPGSFQCLNDLCSPGMIVDAHNRCAPKLKDCSDDQSVCLENQACINIAGEYVCRDLVSCGVGFKLNADANQCQDVDECLEETHNCTGHHMYCANLIGGFSCICTQGFKYSRRLHYCEDVDECLSPRVCPSNARCKNTPGSFRCSCELGFQIRSDSRLCLDINECSTGIHSCEQECLNTVGSYYCSCQKGFKLNPDGFTCSDIDECSENNECQNDGGMCVNMWGSHRCQPIVCPSGFARYHSQGRAKARSTSMDRSGGYKQVFLSLSHPSDQKLPSLFLPSPAIGPQGQPFSMRYKRNVLRHGFHSGESHFVSYGQLQHSRWPIALMVSESAEVVCRRVPCPHSSPQCQSNSTRSIQWHQVLLPSKGFDAKTPVIAIQSEHFTHGSLFQIVGGNIESAFEIRRVSDQSGDRGNIHILRDLENKSYNFIVSMKNLNKEGGIISENLVHIVISTSPQSVT